MTLNRSKSRLLQSKVFNVVEVGTLKSVFKSGFSNDQIIFRVDSSQHCGCVELGRMVVFVMDILPSHPMTIPTLLMLLESNVVVTDPGFRGEEIDKEYERDCEIKIRKLKQDYNIWGSEVRKKEHAYEEEKYAAACRYMLSITCDDEDDYIPSGDIIARYSTSITPDLPIEESENSLIRGMSFISTITQR
ncbi:hypothetical protein Tco_1056531 [Tanacetum coccineum]|uniref:DNA-directed RNA polymerase n=1 Tax=Tanacetum coccineum TaxID=301880 RepID=A0ABQ5H3L0_9ASTR